MKHLVTGGSGFLGNLIARKLLEKGEEVKILDIWEDSSRPKEIEYVEADICDRKKVAQAMKGIDVVHHTVALVPLTKSGKRFHQVNVDGSRIAAEEAVNANVKAFIHMSSSAIFANSKSPITLDTPPSPAEIYGKAKLKGEQEVMSILNESAIPLIVIRPRTILGEGRMGIFQILFDWIQEGKNIYIIGNGEVLFQFIHAHDLIDAYMLALEKGKSGIYNVGTDNFGTLRNALETLIQYANSTSKIKCLPIWLTINGLRLLDFLSLSPLAPWHYLTYHKEFHYDITPLKELGWAPKYSNDTMLKESYDSFLQLQNDSNLQSLRSVHRSPVKEKLLWLIKKFS